MHSKMIQNFRVGADISGFGNIKMLILSGPARDCIKTNLPWKRSRTMAILRQIWKAQRGCGG